MDERGSIELLLEAHTCWLTLDSRAVSASNLTVSEHSRPDLPRLGRRSTLSVALLRPELS